MRATIDLDDPAVDDVVEAWETLSEHGDGVVYGRVSSSGTGVHLKVHGCSPETAEALRWICGDDEKRIAFDQQSSLKPKQIMFSSKGSRRAGSWTTDRDEVLAAYRERAPRAYLRRMLLVVYPVLRELDVELTRTVPEVLSS